jgi:hypothetical protein
MYRRRVGLEALPDEVPSHEGGVARVMSTKKKQGRAKGPTLLWCKTYLDFQRMCAATMGNFFHFVRS